MIDVLMTIMGVSWLGLMLIVSWPEDDEDDDDPYQKHINYKNYKNWEDD